MVKRSQSHGNGIKSIPKHLNSYCGRVLRYQDARDYGEKVQVMAML